MPCKEVWPPSVGKGKSLFMLECLLLPSGGHTAERTGLRQKGKLEGWMKKVNQ